MKQSTFDMNGIEVKRVKNQASNEIMRGNFLKIQSTNFQSIDKSDMKYKIEGKRKRKKKL